MDGKDGLQLLPGTKKRLGIKVPGENRFLYIGSVILGATLVSMFSLNRYEKNLINELNGLNEQIAVLERSRNKKDEGELTSTRDRLALTSGLIKEHSHWTQFFSWLEDIMQSDIQIRNMAAAPQGKDDKVIFTGEAASYTTIARQLAAFLTDPRVKDIVVGKMGTTTGGTVEFTLDIQLELEKILTK